MKCAKCNMSVNGGLLSHLKHIFWDCSRENKWGGSGMKEEELFVTIESLFHEDLVKFESRVRKLSGTEKGIAKSLFISGVYRGLRIATESVSGGAE